MAGRTVEADALLLEADKLALRMLSKPARKLMLILKSLYSGDKSEDEILADCIVYYPGCKSLRPALNFLEKLGIITLKPDTGKYSLTEYGRQVCDLIFDILGDIRKLIKNAMEGKVDPIDLYVQLVTPAMTTIEVSLAPSRREELIFNLTVHTYISALIASTFILLSTKDPRFKSVLSEVEKIFTGEYEGHTLST